MTRSRAAGLVVALCLCAGVVTVAGSAAESGSSVAAMGPRTSLPARLAGDGSSASAGECKSAGVACSRVVVPLDWSGQVSGRISLNVVVHRASGHVRGAMFLLAGGPGQASAELFDLENGGIWQRLFPGYTLVTFDPRGTGESGRLNCPLAGGGVLGGLEIADACARKLGPSRSFYRTADNAMDIDAVRKALGLRKVGVFGVSYGTDLALTYARTFPGRIQRLLLDSVATPFTALPTVGAVLRSIPADCEPSARACAVGDRKLSERCGLTRELARAEAATRSRCGSGWRAATRMADRRGFPRARDRHRSEPWPGGGAPCGDACGTAGGSATDAPPHAAGRRLGIGDGRGERRLPGYEL